MRLWGNLAALEMQFVTPSEVGSRSKGGISVMPTPVFAATENNARAYKRQAFWLAYPGQQSKRSSGWREVA